jgi:predicted phosphodiesterase
MADRDYRGLLLIGDPHLEGRQPGFRKDDYPQVILDKLAWCLKYAADQSLLPAILGDLFDKPRDNPTWMIGRLIDLFRGEVIGIYGNHDCADPQLCENDTLSLLVKAGCLRLLDEFFPWTGRMNGRRVIVGGSSYRCPIPTDFDTHGGQPLVIWLTHHDLVVPGNEAEGKIVPFEIPGIDLVINGHLHHRTEDVVAGKTLWITPGNIARRKRSDATRLHVPSVLRLDVTADRFERQVVEVPHQAFDAVFHEAVVEGDVTVQPSPFIAGLAELQARRTDSGAGLIEFLTKNLTAAEPAVSQEIMDLAREVTAHAQAS